MSRNVSVPMVLLDAKATTGVGNAINVKDYKHIIVAVSAAVNSALTVNFQGSIGKSTTDASAPDFSTAQTLTNHWDYVAFYDLQNPAAVVAGDTGIAYTADTVANNTRLILINTDGISWLSCNVTARSAGSVTAWIVGYTE